MALAGGICVPPGTCSSFLAFKWNLFSIIILEPLMIQLTLFQGMLFI